MLSPVCSEEAAILTELVPFSLGEDGLRLLLWEQTDQSLLPCRIPAADEDLDQCATQALTALFQRDELYLEQLYSFSRQGGLVGVRVAYLALIPSHLAEELCPENARWHPLSALPDLDEEACQVIQLARKRLQDKLSYSTLALQLMPPTFTLSALQSAYELILGESLDKRNFRKRILALDCIEETGEQARNGCHRPARLYRASSPDEVAIIR